MFGLKMRIELPHTQVGGVELVPIEKRDIRDLTLHLSSMGALEYTLRSYIGANEQDELEWLERVRASRDEVVWGIKPLGHNQIIGVTALHRIDIFGGCTSGIIIAPDWQGKGVATCAHLLRTMFAASRLRREAIHSIVMKPNTASRRALERVGYTVTGEIPLFHFVDGEFVTALTLTWSNPEHIQQLYPNGLPRKYRKGVKKARKTLKKARRLVQWI